MPPPIVSGICREGVAPLSKTEAKADGFGVVREGWGCREPFTGRATVEEAGPHELREQAGERRPDSAAPAWAGRNSAARASLWLGAVSRTKDQGCGLRTTGRAPRQGVPSR